MDYNKENESRRKHKSNIPVLVKTAQSNLIKKQSTKKAEGGRPPLKTLSAQRVNQQLAGPSQQNITTTNKVTNISDEKKNQLTNIEKLMVLRKDKLFPITVQDENTFSTPPLEVDSVRRIKKSLKRPHSRELQNLPPLEKKKEDVKRRINFYENVPLSTHATFPVIDDLSHTYTTDALKYLLIMEKKPLGSNLSDEDRSRMVDYILQISGPHEDPAIAQIACWYLESYKYDAQATRDQLKLIAAACYWIAKKICGGAITGSRIVRRTQYKFNIRALAEAERQIFTQLNFPSQPIVSQEFLPYFCWWCAPTCGRLNPAATFLCKCGLTASRVLANEYPSVIAAAAMVISLQLLNQDNLLPKLYQCPLFQAAKKKVPDLTSTCAELRKSVPTLVSGELEYKAAFYQQSDAPVLCMCMMKILIQDVHKSCTCSCRKININDL